MRTTITIDDEVYRSAKALAARSARSVSELIEDAVRAALRTSDLPADELPPLPTFGRGGTRPGIDLADRSSLADALDAEVGIDALH